MLPLSHPATRRHIPASLNMLRESQIYKVLTTALGESLQ